MSKRNRLTNNSDETDIATLISGDIIFSIPYFQRAYKWKTERLEQLNNDLLNVVDETVDIHFLGAIIIHGRRSNPSEPTIFDVIDGQQRITTLFIYLAAVVKILCNQGSYQEASNLFQKYLVIGRKTNLISNLKLHSCKEDRKQLNFVIKDILSDKNFENEIAAINMDYLPSSEKEKDKGQLKKNYKYLLKFLDNQHGQGGLERIRKIYEALLDSMSVVQIDVYDPTNGPKIFDSLNSRQEPMTIGDLVRNEIFSKVANAETIDIDRIDENHWQPFYRKFKVNNSNLFDSYFFPYGLIQDSNLKKSEVYNFLRRDWIQIDEPKSIIEKLSEYQNAFIDLETRSNLQEHSKKIAKLISNLVLANMPSSTYPFLMQLSNGIKSKEITEKDGERILEIIESFLVRRAVCGIEPTGLHAVFKRLWKDCQEKPTPESVTKNIKKHKTVMWPNNKIFREMIESRPMYGVGITKYLILQYDEKLGGDLPSNVPWIEHILPVKPESIWFKHFTHQEHEMLKDRLANLIPLSKEMNQNISNKAYSIKRKKYLEDSMFKSARVLANSNNEWTPKSIDKRSKELSKWALERWPDFSGIH